MFSTYSAFGWALQFGNTPTSKPLTDTKILSPNPAPMHSLCPLVVSSLWTETTKISKIFPTSTKIVQ